MIGLDAVAMVKKSSRARYESNGEPLSLKKIPGDRRTEEHVGSSEKKS